MNRLEIKLKQHTPLIHFQHDQEGATLRASEVKPKLDRFVLTRLGKDNYDEISGEEFDKVASLYEKSSQGKDFNDLSRSLQEQEVGKYLASQMKWFIGKGEHHALNYKMRIEVSSSNEREEFLLASYLKQDIVNSMQQENINAVSNTPYFAQEKENGIIAKASYKKSEWDKIGKKGILERGTILLTIFCLDDTAGGALLKKVAEYIQSFFVSTNFGTRQSKGFGCFTVTEIRLNGGNPLTLKNDVSLIKENFLFVYKKTIYGNGANRITNIFSTINNEYKITKSGKTTPKPYVKSKMMLYAGENDLGWDKKYIKSKTDGTFRSTNGQEYHLKCSPENKKSSYANRDDYKYFRAMLGLAEQLEFQLANPPEGKSSNKMIVKICHPDISRYQSPLLFKVIDNDIYLVGNRVSVQMLNKTFNLTVTIQGDRDNKNVPIDNIKTPMKFSLLDFMRFAMKDKSLRYEQLK